MSTQISAISLPSRLGISVARIAVCAAAAGVLFSLTMPARAQFYGVPPGYGGYDGPGSYNRPPPVFRGNERPLPPDAVVERVEEAGFDDVGRPRYNGSVYVVEATNRRGLRVRVVVDAFRGEIVDRYPLGRAEGDDFAYRSRGPLREPDEEPRGWFGNNLRPPEEAPPYQRYGGRPSDRLPDQEPLSPLGSQQNPVPATPSPEGNPRPAEAARPSATGRATAQPSKPSTARSQAPVAASRPPAVASVPLGEPGRGEGSVEGLNPGTSAGSPRPSSTGPAEQKRASKPEPRRELEQQRSASTDKNEALSPIRPTITPKPPATPPNGGSASIPGDKSGAPTSNEAASGEASRPDRSVRIIQGVTPMAASPAVAPRSAEPASPGDSSASTRQ